MKKNSMVLIASMLLLSTATYAQSITTNTKNTTSFNKKDTQALFGTNKVKTSKLDVDEMQKTEGQWSGWVGAGVAGHLVYTQGWSHRPYFF